LTNSNYTPQSWLTSGSFFDLDLKDIQLSNAKATDKELTSIFYRTSPAANRCILLLHGFPTSSYDWAKMWDLLAADDQVICLDFLGFGYSTKPYPHKYSIFEQLEICAALLAHLGINEVHILAHDYAVSVAQEGLAQQAEGKLPFKIASVCFLNGGMFSDSYHPRLIQKLLLSPMGPMMVPFVRKGSLRRNFKAIFGRDTQPTEKEIDDFWELISYNNGRRVIPGVIQYLEERQQNDRRWTNAVVQSDVPCQLINGPEDPISGRSLLEKYEAIIPNAKTVALEGIGHYPNVEAPEVVAVAYLTFLNQ